MKKIIIFLTALLIALLLVLLSGIFYFYVLFEGITMEIGEKEAAELRDELHNLDIVDNYDSQVYYEKLYYIIASGEGFSSEVYGDSKDLLTIGYGFNMDRGDTSKKEWNDIFKGSISFDDAKKGAVSITKEQARMLKKYGVNKREKELAKIYDPYWNKMRLNERAILTDLYYQAPKLAGEKTRFSEHLKEYYKTGNMDYFELAVSEVKFHSSYAKNIRERIGLQNRNDIRAIILDSRECALYSNPNDELIPEAKKLKITLGETIISRDISANFPKSNKLGDYYIWRTCMDDKVRSSHKDLEGKVFKHEYKINHPGDEHGCRCYKEILPIHAKIIEEENIEEENMEEQNKMLKYYHENRQLYTMKPELKKEYPSEI